MNQPPDPIVVAKSTVDFREYAAVLDGALEGRTWLLDGDRPSYADFRVATPLPFAAGADMP